VVCVLEVAGSVRVGGSPARFVSGVRSLKVAGWVCSRAVVVRMSGRCVWGMRFFEEVCCGVFGFVLCADWFRCDLSVSSVWRQ